MPKKLFIILVILILLTLGLVAILFLFPAALSQPPGETQEPQAPPLSDGDTPGAVKPVSPPASQAPLEIREFDESIFDTKQNTVPETENALLRAELQLLARNFLDTYGSFSSNSGYAHIAGLYEKMTPSFQDFTSSWLGGDPAASESSNFYSIQTAVAQTEIQTLTKSQATILLDTRRVETDAPEFYNKVFNQTARVVLKKMSGVWKIDGVFWE